MFDFFLSYATGSRADNALVERLYEDVCADVRLYGGERGAPAGFLDRGMIRAGMRWSDELVSALATCRVLIALCSPAYFASRACGQEWTIFLRRLDLAGRELGRIPGALVPLNWVLAPVPAVAAQFQHDDRDFGPAYREHGVRELARQANLRGEYERFVDGLARRIVDLSKAAEVPPYADVESADFQRLASAFHEAEEPGRCAVNPVPPQPVRDDMLAPTQSENPGVSRGQRPILQYLYPPPGETDGTGRQDGDDDPDRRRD